MKNDTMRFFLYSIKLAENKELAKTFLPGHSKTFFSIQTINAKTKKQKKHIKRKNDNNQI